MHAALLCAATTSPSLPARATDDAACASAAVQPALVADTASYLSASDLTRLERILAKGQNQTGVQLRVLTRSRASKEWTYDLSAVRCRLGITSPSQSLLIVGDRGIQGALDAGSAFLTFPLVGNGVKLALPDVFFARLKQEYGRKSFVDLHGEAASLVTAVELILTCLRSEEGFCTTVPPASTYF